MAKKQIQAQENISPNLVPMVDIIFLMLLFFMLGADMGQRELEEVKLPQASSVQEDKDNDDPNKLPRVNVNVFHDFEKCPDYKDGDGVCTNEDHWKIGIKGNEWNRLGEPIKDENRAGEGLHDYLLAEANKERKDATNTQLSERQVMIRADKGALYGYVQRVMNACAEVGIYQVEVGAAEKVTDDKPKAE